MDFGYPQCTELSVLKECVNITDAHRRGQLLKAETLANQITGPGLHLPGPQYRKNEVFCDVVEQVNMQMNSMGNVLSSDILGKVLVKTHLSGMPEMQLGLNERVFANGRLEDVHFHQCVRLSRYEKSRVIACIPPDGEEFAIMSYRMNGMGNEISSSSSSIQPIVRVQCAAKSHSHTRIEYTVRVRSQFKRHFVAKTVEIRVPVPADIAWPQFETNVGTVKYQPEKDCMIWLIKQMSGQSEFVLHAQFARPSVANEEDKATSKPPINVKFTVPFAVSGFQIRYLKVVERQGYIATPWVRYLSQNGDYQIRMPVYS